MYCSEVLNHTFLTAVKRIASVNLKYIVATNQPEHVYKAQKLNTGIPRFTLLMWGHIKDTRKAKTARVNQGYLVVLKRRKIE